MATSPKKTKLCFCSNDWLEKVQISRIEVVTANKNQIQFLGSLCKPRAELWGTYALKRLYIPPQFLTVPPGPS